MITHPPTTNASSYSHQQITQSFLQVSNSYLLAGKSSIGMQFNFVFVSHGHKNHGKPTLNLQSGEYLDFLFQTLKKTHRNLFIYLFIYKNQVSDGHWVGLDFWGSFSNLCLNFVYYTICCFYLS
jgi:hypothetical protein